MNTNGHATVEAEFSRGPRGLVITRIVIEAPLPGGLTHGMLKNVPLAAILADARCHAAPQTAVPIDIPRTAGRTPMTGDLLRAVALVFIEETGPGKDRRAIQRMAERFGRPEGTLRTWIARARKDGWLMPGSKGRIGGEAGPRLRAWMAS